MTGKTDQPQATPEAEAVARPTTTESTAGAAPAVLQQALSEIGAELSNFEQSAAAAMRQMQQRLESLSQQLEASEKQVAEKLAAANQAAEQAERAKQQALTQLAERSSDGDASSGEPSAAEVPTGIAVDSAAADDPRKVVEPAIEQSPPPATAGPAPATAAHASMPPHLMSGEAPDAAAPVGPQAAEPAAPAPRAMPARAVLPAVAAPAVASPAASNYAFERAVLGEALAADPGLSAERGELIHGLLSGDDDASALAGQLLIFSAASSERMPQLLRDVGEAYYAWRPYLGHDPFRDALIQHIRARCEEAGVGNTIELVRPGDRFDHTRHNSKARGVEIDDVYGWVVLRDNGKVYTKASVSTK
ncbi:MAG: hypothetical protein RIC55_11785 [Pirellulaceae bacterium]